jgi:hypothetical protein
MERFKRIETEKGEYYIGSNGSVKSIRYGKERMLKPWIINSGYLAISLGKSNKWLLHRLVAEAYCEKPTNADQVNHIDGNKLNNSYDNLEWCTASDNMKHASSVLNINKKKIVATIGDCKIAVFNSLKEAVNSAGANYSSLSRALHNDNKCIGFSWQFSEK